VIEPHPIALQLRYLQTLIEISSAPSTTIVFPAPVDILARLLPPFVDRSGETAGGETPPGPPA
jgi:hypothetical protein